MQSIMSCWARQAADSAAMPHRLDKREQHSGDEVPSTSQSQGIGAMCSHAREVKLDLDLHQ